MVQQELLPLVQEVRAETPDLVHVVVVGSEQHAPQQHVYSFGHMLQSYPSTPLTGIEPGMGRCSCPAI